MSQIHSEESHPSFHVGRNAEEAAAFLKLLAHPSRLKICCQLRYGEMSVGDLESHLDLRQPNLSRELAKLREGGVLTTRRQSKLVFYRLATPRVTMLVEALCAAFARLPDGMTASIAPMQRADHKLSGMSRQAGEPH